VGVEELKNLETWKAAECAVGFGYIVVDVYVGAGKEGVQLGYCIALPGNEQVASSSA
jgi:hypothetical protein